MDSSTINSDTISFKDGNSNNVPGTWNMVTDSSIEFSAEHDLDYSTTYTVTVSTEVANTEGVKLKEPFVLDFSTKKRYWTINLIKVR